MTKQRFFSLVWEVLEAAGQCDAEGGCEWERVRDHWENGALLGLAAEAAWEAVRSRIGSEHWALVQVLILGAVQIAKTANQKAE